MTLGLFVFTLDTVPFQQRQRQTTWRHPRQSLVGARPAAQFLGPEADDIELSGVLMPEITGGTLSLEGMRAMAETGIPWPLIDGSGFVYGLYVIQGIDETGSHLMDDGAAQRIAFTLRLSRTDDFLSEAVGAAIDSASAAAVGLTTAASASLF